MSRPRQILAGIACVACCAGPIVVAIAGGTTAALAWFLWPAVAVAVVLATIAGVEQARHRQRT